MATNVIRLLMATVAYLTMGGEVATSATRTTTITAIGRYWGIFDFS